MDVDRVRVAGEIYELPELILVEYRKEGGGILEVGGDGVVAGGLLPRSEGNGRCGMAVWGDGQFAHGEHVGFAVELPLDQGNGASRRAGQRLRRRRPVVRGELGRDGAAGDRAFDDA